MSKKVIALGNRLMMDDGIAVVVLENIEKQLGNKGIEVIFGETDVDYCISKLNAEDEFYIIDATHYDSYPGKVIVTSLEDMKKQYISNNSIHSLGLIDLININKLDIKGYFIGIEISCIDINIGLSNSLEQRLEAICNKVLNFII